MDLARYNPSMADGKGDAVPAAARGRNTRFRSGLRAVAFGIVSNLALILLKGTAGVLGHSQGLVADAIHSGADLINSLSAFASLLVSRRPADLNHPYGHGRAEALAANFASFVIGAAGLIVAWESLQKLRSGQYEAPALLALWVALVALAIKLGLAVYATRVARRVHSKAVNADARDHISDVAGTAFVIAGIVMARLGHPRFDPLAGFIVAGFIVYTALGLFREAAHELMDTSISAELCQAILPIVEQVPGVAAISSIAGRTLADMTVVEVHIDVAPTMPASEVGQVIDQIKRSLIGQVADVSHVVVEVNSNILEPDALGALRRQYGSRPIDPVP